MHHFSQKIEEIRTICRLHAYPTGHWENLLDLPFRLSQDTGLRSDVVEIVRSLQRGSLHLPDVLDILVLAVGGSDAPQHSRQLSEPLNLLGGFLLGIGRWPDTDSRPILAPGEVPENIQKFSRPQPAFQSEPAPRPQARFEDRAAAVPPPPEQQQFHREMTASDAPPPRTQDPRPQDPRPQDPRPQDPRPQDPRPQDPRPQDPRTPDPRAQDPRRQNPRTGDPHSQPQAARPGPPESATAPIADISQALARLERGTFELRAHLDSIDQRISRMEPLLESDVLPLEPVRLEPVRSEPVRSQQVPPRAQIFSAPHASEPAQPAPPAGEVRPPLLDSEPTPVHRDPNPVHRDPARREAAPVPRDPDPVRPEPTPIPRDRQPLQAEVPRPAPPKAESLPPELFHTEAPVHREPVQPRPAPPAPIRTPWPRSGSPSPEPVRSDPIRFQPLPSSFSSPAGSVRFNLDPRPKPVESPRGPTPVVPPAAPPAAPVSRVPAGPAPIRSAPVPSSPAPESPRPAQKSSPAAPPDLVPRFSRFSRDSAPFHDESTAAAPTAPPPANSSVPRTAKTAQAVTPIAPAQRSEPRSRSFPSGLNQPLSPAVSAAPAAQPDLKVEPQPIQPKPITLPRGFFGTIPEPDELDLDVPTPRPRSRRTFALVATILILLGLAGGAAFLYTRSGAADTDQAASSSSISPVPAPRTPETGTYTAPGPLSTSPSRSPNSKGSTTAPTNKVLGARNTFQPRETDEEPGSANGFRPAANFVPASVMDGHLISAPMPAQPRVPASSGNEGIVVMEVNISNTGQVEDLYVLGGNRALRPAAVEAVRNWRYKPYLLNGTPIEVRTIVRVDFNEHRSQPAERSAPFPS